MNAGELLSKANLSFYFDGSLLLIDKHQDLVSMTTLDVHETHMVIPTKQEVDLTNLPVVQVLTNRAKRITLNVKVHMTRHLTAEYLTAIQVGLTPEDAFKVVYLGEQNETK